MSHTDPAKDVEAAGIAAEDIERAIVDIGNAMRALNGSRLTRRAIVLLLHDLTKQPMKNIDYVLNALGLLESTFLKTRKPGEKVPK